MVIMHQFAASRSYEEHLDKATFKMMAYHQGEYDTVVDHICNIRNLHKVTEHYGGWMVSNKALTKRQKKKIKKTEPLSRRMMSINCK